MPAVSPTTVFTDPAALKLTQLLPFQQYTLLSSVSSAS
jgi:hypothetical protein